MLPSGASCSDSSGLMDLRWQQAPSLKTLVRSSLGVTGMGIAVLPYQQLCLPKRYDPDDHGDAGDYAAADEDVITVAMVMMMPTKMMIIIMVRIVIIMMTVVLRTVRI